MVLKLTALALFFAIAIDGPLRFLLVSHGLAWLIYIPKSVALVLVVYYAVRAVFCRQISSYGLGLTGLIGSGVITGVFYIDEFRQIWFGVFMLVPLLFGVIFAEQLQDNWLRFGKYVATLFWLTLGGILLERVMTFPWTGFSYEISGIQLEASRHWMMFGINRLAGFTRASTSAAGILMVTGIYVIAWHNKVLFKFIVWTGAFAGILLTTSKGIAIAFVMASAFFVSARQIPKGLWALGRGGLLVVMFMLPMLNVLLNYASKYAQPGETDYLYTLKARINETWPAIWELLSQHGSYIFGRGIGGVGTPQAIFSPDLPSSTDNLFVHIYGQIGILGAIVLVLVVVASGKLKYAQDPWQRVVASWLIGMLGYGITNNVIQGAYLAAAMGVVIGTLSLRLQHKNLQHLIPQHDSERLSTQYNKRPADGIIRCRPYKGLGED